MTLSAVKVGGANGEGIWDLDNKPVKLLWGVAISCSVKFMLSGGLIAIDWV